MPLGPHLLNNPNHDPDPHPGAVAARDPPAIGERTLVQHQPASTSTPSNHKGKALLLGTGWNPVLPVNWYFPRYRSQRKHMAAFGGCQPLTGAPRTRRPQDRQPRWHPPRRPGGAGLTAKRLFRSRIRIRYAYRHRPGSLSSQLRQSPRGDRKTTSRFDSPSPCSPKGRGYSGGSYVSVAAKPTLGADSRARPGQAIYAADVVWRLVLQFTIEGSPGAFFS
jgi:hypothetical protein